MDPARRPHDIRTSTRRLVAALGSLLLLAGCSGAYQVSPDDVQTVGSLKPNVEDKDAGLVALAPGLDMKTYKVVAVDKFPVTDRAIKDDDDRRRAAEMVTILQNELVRRLRWLAPSWAPTAPAPPGPRPRCPGRRAGSCEIAGAALRPSLPR
jgi:hypothetical protein